MKEKTSFSEAFGQRIKKARKAAGYTQERLAEELNVTNQYISDLERGLVGTALDTLVNLCKILNVSSDSLLFDVDETPELSNILYKISSLSNEELEILDRGIDLLLIAIRYENMKKE